MRSFDDAKALVAYATDVQLPTVSPLYDAAAGTDSLPPALLIQTKHLLDSLRSALDYTMYGLWETKLGQPTRRVYYPYASAGHDEADFRRRLNDQRLGLPEYAAARPDVIDQIARFQHYAGHDFGWVPRFMEISNSRKHKSLGDQLPLVVFGFSIEADGQSHLVNGDTLTVPAAGLTIGRLRIPPGEYNYRDVLNHLPPRPGFGIQILRPVGVVFADARTIGVLPFLGNAVRGVSAIVESLIGMA